MKILLLNNFHYRKGGSETVYFNTGELLKEHGHEVEYFSLQQSDNIPARYERYFGYGKDSAINTFSKVRNMFWNTSAAKGLQYVLDDFKPDVAHIHLVWGGLTGSVIETLKKNNIPVVVTTHDYRMVCPAYLFMNGKGEVCEKCKGHSFWHCALNRCSHGSAAQSLILSAEAYFRTFKNPYRHIDHIIYVSDFCRKIHHKYNDELRGKPGSVLFNFNTVGASVRPENPELFTFCGRLSREKGVMTLVKAFAKLPELRLQLIGTGRVEVEIRKFINDNSLGNIELKGYMTGEPLKKAIAESRFMCVPSEYYENNPMSAIEALSMGIPVIGAEIGGIPEIVSNGSTGYLFPSGDVSALVDVISQAGKLSEVEYKEMGRNCIEFASESFDKENYYKKLIEIYKSLKK